MTIKFTFSKQTEKFIDEMKDKGWIINKTELHADANLSVVYCLVILKFREFLVSYNGLGGEVTIARMGQQGPALVCEGGGYFNDPERIMGFIKGLTFKTTANNVN